MPARATHERVRERVHPKYIYFIRNKRCDDFKVQIFTAGGSAGAVSLKPCVCVCFAVYSAPAAAASTLLAQQKRL